MRIFEANRDIRQTESTPGLQVLRNALQTASHSRFIDKPETMSSLDSVVEGNKILGHLFGNKDVSRNIAAKAAMQTNVNSELVKKALPLIAGLAMSALSKLTKRGQSIGYGVRDSGPSPLAGILGNDEFGIDDVRCGFGYLGIPDG